MDDHLFVPCVISLNTVLVADLSAQVDTKFPDIVKFPVKNNDRLTAKVNSVLIDREFINRVAARC